MGGYICRCEVLLVTGLKSRYVTDTEVIHKEMTPGMCSMIKVMMMMDKVIILMMMELILMEDTEVSQVIHKDMDPEMCSMMKVV